MNLSLSPYIYILWIHVYIYIVSTNWMTMFNRLWWNYQKVIIFRNLDDFGLHTSFQNHGTSGKSHQELWLFDGSIVRLKKTKDASDTSHLPTIISYLVFGRVNHPIQIKTSFGQIEVSKKLGVSQNHPLNWLWWKITHGSGANFWETSKYNSSKSIFA